MGSEFKEEPDQNLSKISFILLMNIVPQKSRPQPQTFPTPPPALVHLCINIYTLQEPGWGGACTPVLVGPAPPRERMLPAGGAVSALRACSRRAHDALRAQECGLLQSRRMKAWTRNLRLSRHMDCGGGAKWACTVLALA